MTGKEHATARDWTADREFAVERMQETMWSRAVKGVAIVMALFAVLALADAFSPSESVDVSAETADAASMVQAVVSGRDLTASGGVGVPDDFNAEMFPTKRFDDLRQNRDGTVVGMECNGAAVETFDWCAEQMEERGWVLIESGQDSSASFLKEEGGYAWAYMDCTTVGNRTSVVVVLQPR